MATAVALPFSIPLFLILLFLSSVTSAAEFAIWGPRVRIGPAHSEIISMRTEFQPGYPPEKEEEFMALWPGLWNPRSLSYDLIQSVTSVHNRSYMKSFCNARPGQWCTQAYVLKSGYPDTPRKGYAIDGDDVLTIEYVRDYLGTGKWTQTVTSLKRGHLVTFTSGEKPATVVETGTEMQLSMAAACKGPTDPQTYTNLTVVLREPEPDFGATFERDKKRGLRAIVDRPVTEDGGLTWVVRKIVLPRMGPGVSWRPPDGKTEARGEKPDPNHGAKHGGGKGKKKKGNEKESGRETVEPHRIIARKFGNAMDGCKWGGNN